jgi:hypothetical protein
MPPTLPLLADITAGDIVVALILIAVIGLGVRALIDYALKHPAEFRRKLWIGLAAIGWILAYPFRAAKRRAAAEEEERERRQRAERRRREREREEDEQRQRERAEGRRRQEEEDRARRLREEREEAERRERGESEARRRAAEVRHAALHPLWAARPKLRRCAAPEPHFFPACVTGPCPLCSDRHTHTTDGFSGLTEAEFLRAFDPASEPPLDFDPLPEEDLGEIEREFDKRLKIRDFPGIANRILELLLLPPQEREPRESGLLLARRIDALVAARFGLHEATTYPRPLRDELLHFAARGKWPEDTFHQLLIFAHVLAPTWKTLPPPYDRLRPFYVTLAERQATLIQEVAADRAGLDRMLNSRYPEALRNRVSPIPLKPITEDDE